jgi:tetratricopeptide (TPR) repeat protein
MAKEFTMISTARKLVLFCAGLVLFGGLASAQVGSIAGTVIGEDGNPAQGIQILIERTDVKGNYKVKTKKKGDFFHAGLPLGTYTVSCEVKGEVVDRVSGVRVGMGDPTAVNFDLAEMKKKQQAAQASGAAGSQPSEEQLRSMSKAERDAYEQALNQRKQQISKNKELNEAFNGGMEQMRGNDFAGAVASFTTASGLDPAQHVIWAQLAEAQSKLAPTKTGAERDASYAASIAAYDKAIELAPDSAAYYNNYGLTLVKMGKLEEGQAKLGQAAQLDPVNGGRYYFNLGAVMVNSGNTQGAIDAFRKATEVDPNYADAYYQLGVALTGAAEYGADVSIKAAPGTVEAFQKFIELRPGTPAAEQAQGMIQTLTGTVETSFEDPSKAKKKK